MASTAARRVIVAYEPTPIGQNALWCAVMRAREHQAVLFVVRVVPSPRPLPRWPMPPVSRHRLTAEFCTEVADALLLAAGDLADNLDVRIAVVFGDRSGMLARLADADDDLLVLPAPRGRELRAAGRGMTLIAVDATTPPKVLR